MKFSLSPRMTLLIIAAMFVFPLLLAWLMYSGSLDFEPGSTRNLGKLVEPPVPVDWTVAVMQAGVGNSAVEYEQGSSVFDEHWVILLPVPVACDDSCLNKAAELRQIHRASGRQQLRIRLALLMEEPSPADQFQSLLSIYPQFNLFKDPSGLLWEALGEIQQKLSRQTGPARGVYIIDPAGNIMLYYETGSDPGFIKQDLKQLLN